MSLTRREFVKISLVVSSVFESEKKAPPLEHVSRSSELSTRAPGAYDTEDSLDNDVSVPNADSLGVCLCALLSRFAG